MIAMIDEFVFVLISMAFYGCILAAMVYKAWCVAALAL